MNKIVVYTCIIGDYDTLKPVCNRSSRIDYICFTDNPHIKSDGVWEIRRLPPDDLYTDGLSKIKKQRIVKILPHVYLKDYEISIWIDGNIQITGNLIFEFLNALDLNNHFMFVNRHPSRDCIYREEVDVLRRKKDLPENTNPQIRRYKEEGFPEHFGLAETNIIVRKHNDYRCKKLMFDWAKEIINGSHRDQLSFDYCRWKNGMSQFIGWIEENLHYTSKTGCFRIYSHGQNPVKLIGTTMLPHVIIHKYEIDEKQKLEEEKKKLEEEKKKLIEEQKKKEEEFKKKLEEEKQKMLEEQLQKIEELEDKQEELEAEKEKTDEKLVFLIKKLETTKNQLKALEELNRKFNELNKKYDLEKVNSEKIIEKFKTDKKLLIDTIDGLKATIKEEKEKLKQEQKKICIFTCILKNYDSLIDVTNLLDKFDFICFTDNLKMEPNGWKLKPIPEDILRYSIEKQQRLVKMLPHIYLPKKYDVSLYIDGNLQIISTDLTKNFFEKYPLGKEFIYINKHPQRDCLYDEAVVCKQKKKDRGDIIDKQIKRYKAEGFPAHFGLFENNILLRKHTDKRCIELMNEWAKELINGSKRDQLSLTYCQWKLGLHIGLLKEDIRNFLNHKNNFKIIPHKLNKGVTIGMCNFNGTRLTNACVKSIIKNCGLPDFKIVILDNSDKEKFVLEDGIDTNVVEVLDNTEGQYIDFQEVVEKYGGEIDQSVVSGYANLRHAYGIQFLIDRSPTSDFVLFDNDTILKKKIDFIDNRYISISGFQNPYMNKGVLRKQRFLPFIQYFNKKMMNDYKVCYFNSRKIMNGNGPHAMEYDTGSSFAEAVTEKFLPFKIINVPDYIEHLMGASWAKVHDESAFLEKNKDYYS